MKIRALIADDEPLARSRLRRLLGRLDVQVVAEASDGQKAIEMVNNYDIDIVFIDINMPLKNGLEAAYEIIKSIKQAPAIIFCTAHDEYAVKAFELNAVAYLLKPIGQDALLSAIKNAQQLNKLQLEHLFGLQDNEATIVVRNGSVTENMPMSKFVYFRSVNKHVYAKPIGGNDVLVDYTLKKLEQIFEENFIRIHRNCLVNRHYAEKIVRDESGRTCVKLMHSDVELDVSRRHLAEVKKCFR